MAPPAANSGCGQQTRYNAQGVIYPCMETFMRGLPHTYRNIAADEGTLIEVTINTEAGGNWYLQRNTENWILIKDTEGKTPDAAITIKPDTAWKLFTKGIKQQAAIKEANMRGDEKLTEVMFNMISVMA
ncbi:hypothetical protein [Mucilaginibacter sp.]|uniref:hypothetical protein n=1 Tax=Mucilaginibacter sp. TaxID=1882438 RepID=UPI0026093097|nr:hypothetical protein [Mucilaginibacter sp.]MDB4923843.1 hypothetical protein [Mucilaginibacter sp.]